MNAQLRATIEEMLLPFMQEHEWELVDMEYLKEGSNWFLRIFVDKDGGIDIDECCKISEFLSMKLDENDPLSTAYFLEVSSPGAERPLKKVDDFRKAVGKQVFITTTQHINGMNEFEGKLLDYEEGGLTVGVGKKKVAISTDLVASARLAIVF